METLGIVNTVIDYTVPGKWQIFLPICYLNSNLLLLEVNNRTKLSKTWCRLKSPFVELSPVHSCERIYAWLNFARTKVRNYLTLLIQSLSRSSKSLIERICGK